MEFSLLLLVLCALAFLTGVLLNGYVFIVGCHMERTVSAILFVSQAMADFFFIIFLPLVFTSIILDLDVAKRLSSTITSLHLYSSAFFLTAISVHRCILVARPGWAQNHCMSQLTLCVVLGIWALSFGFSLRCADLWESLISPDSISDRFRRDERRLKAAVAMQFLVGFLIPLTLILILTFNILLAAEMRRNSLSQSTKPFKILLGLILTFFICWLPYHVFCFLEISAIYRLSLGIIEWSFVCVPAYFSSCLKPTFFFTMEDEFLRYRQRARNPQTTDSSGPEPTE